MEKDIIQQQREQTEDMLETRLLTPETAVFTATEGGFAALTYGGKTYDRVWVYRAFPFTCPEGWLSVREANDAQREIGLIRELSDFDESTVALLREQLDLRYFVPVITKIREIKEEFGYSYWSVVTDRGDYRFTCDQNGVIKLSDNRLLVCDVDGNRFDLPSVENLSAKELRMIDLYL